MGVQACQLLVEDNLEKCEKSKRISIVPPLN